MRINMKHIRITFISLLALLLITSPLAAQDNRTLETKVADLLVQVPATDQLKLNEQMQSMLGMEEAGLQMILDLVIPPGTGDDTKPRVAIESLSRYLSQAGMEKEQAAWEKMVLDKIQSSENPFITSFFIRQLNYFGSEAAMQSLIPYLTDPVLQDPAIRAMRDINPERAADLFADHLNQCQGRNQIALVNALKNTGNSSHAEKIASLAGSDSPELQRSVLACLAQLGNPSSSELLIAAAKDAGYMPESTDATGSLVVYARVLADQKQNELSMKICKALMKSCKAPEQSGFKTGALLITASQQSIEQAIPLLVSTMKDKSKAYRMSAIRYAAEARSPADAWEVALDKSKSKEVKSEILYLLGELKDKGSSLTVSKYIKDPDSKVRQQAISSYVLINQDEALPLVLDYTLTNLGQAESETALSCLLQIVKTEQLPLLAEQLSEAPEGAKIVLTEVIAAKGDPAYFDTLYELAREGGATGSAAIANLYMVSNHQHLDLLLPLYDKQEDRSDRSSVEKAIVRAINSSPEKTKATEHLIVHAKNHASIEDYMGVLTSVGGARALKAVYEICLNDASPGQEQALTNYLRIVSGSDLPDDQKLLLLRKVSPLSKSIKQQKHLIGAMGGVKTFLSMITLSSFMDMEDLESEAANALVRVVLPSNGEDNGLTGALVQDNLKKARDIISGPDTEYLKIDIQNYLDKMPDEKGFVSMFNGKDLSGWQGLATDPLKKAQLSDKELQKLQIEADAKVKNNWSVKDKCIVFNGSGSNLCSVKQYGSFEMIVDWRITREGDSGIYLRGSPQVQIWDTSRVDVGAQVGSGGLYNNQVNENKPLLVADNPINDWNTFRIIMIGERVSVYLNGQLVVDNVVMENYWDRSIPIFPTGSIELQAHGTDLAFRDIYVRELDDPNCLTEEERAEGFVALFNGVDLSNWAGNEHSYSVEDGNIVIHPQKSGGNLYTAEEYADFVFRFEFKLTPGANNGLGIRTPMEGDAAYVGCELQILDNTAPVYANLQPYQYHGSVYGIIPAKRGYLKPVGEWNYEEVYLKGDKIRITLNDTVIVDGNLKEASKNGTADQRDHPGLSRTSGHIGFLGHGSLLWFRNIRIKEL
jgi:HEAT repeat protein